MHTSRIMVVDDETVISMQLEEFLTSIGHEVVGRASSGEEAIINARKLRPYLIIMDIVMQGELDGIAAAKIIKEELDIPVIFLTAYGEDKLIEKARDVQPLGYIIKPFNKKEMKATVEIALHRIAIERQQEQLMDRINKMSMAVARSSCSVVITNTEGNIEYVNPKFTQITGYKPEEVIGRNSRILKSGKTPVETFKELWETITSGREWCGEFCNKKKNGELYWYSASISPIKNKKGIIANFVCVSENITERIKTEGIVKHMAYYDDLTGLPNLILFIDRLTMEVAHGRRTKNMLAVIHLGLDGFKEINDVYGHNAGDLLLQEFAKRLKGCIREEDTVSRLGGDEFMILLPRITKKEDVLIIVDKILLISKQTFELGGKKLRITAGIGVVMYPNDGGDAETLIKNADKSRYMAKKLGKNSYMFYKQGDYK